LAEELGEECIYLRIGQDAELLYPRK
jgi:hypothetical protein